MAAINMFRGGTPDFKAMFCGGSFAEFGPSFSSPHYDDTPPFNSHVDGAQGQGYLNLWFPLVPNLQSNDAHKWMRNALENVSAVGDIIRLAWVPLRSYVPAQYFELVRGDSLLNGVYVKPVAERVSWDFAKKDYVYAVDEDYAAAVTASNVGQFPLGIPGESDQQYGYVNLLPTAAKPVPCTFGHNIKKYDKDGNPVAGLDDYYGAVVLGLQIAEGSTTAIANIWKGNFAFYMTAKCVSFECATQIG